MKRNRWVMKKRNKQKMRRIRVRVMGGEAALGKKLRMGEIDGEPEEEEEEMEEGEELFLTLKFT